SDALEPWQRLLALSGVAFAPFFVVGWLASAVANSPNYIDANQKWIKWARDDHIKGRVSSFALLLAVFLFIYFLGSPAERARRGGDVGSGLEGACAGRVRGCFDRHCRHHDGIRLVRQCRGARFEGSSGGEQGGIDERGRAVPRRRCRLLRVPARHGRVDAQDWC